jgi:putative PIN family toxin of toxin-antitoxin system
MTDADHPRQTRVIVDANVLISFLAGRGNLSTSIGRAVTLALGNQFRLIVPDRLVTELRNAAFKRKLIGRVSANQIEDLIDVMLGEVATSVTVEPLPVSAVVRDPKDRYLLEAAIQHEVDILVSGDKDLLALAEFLELPRIMSPAEFVAEFGES